MKRARWLIVGCCLLTIGSSGVITLPVQAATMAERTSGRILLDVEHSGEAWYVFPRDLRRYYLGRPDDAFSLMRFLSLGITNADLAKIPTESQTETGDIALRQRLSGYILLQVEGHGEAWYVYPGNLKRYYLGRPADAFRLMTQLGLGITAADLASIPIGSLSGRYVVPQEFQSYTLTFERGSFAIDVIRLKRSDFSLVSDTGNATDCDNNCPAQSLAAYAQENGARFGIHGSYFCPPDYPACQSKINSFLPPFYNTALDRMLNEDALPFHAGPMIVETDDDQIRYYHRTIDFGWSVADFQRRTGKTVRAAVSNYPSLVENGTVVVEQEPLEAGQRLRATRGGIGYSDTSWWFLIARSASVIDLGYIFKELGAEYALNLDGGGSVALMYEGEYRVGPGRQLPNAVLFQAR